MASIQFPKECETELGHQLGYSWYNVCSIIVASVCVGSPLGPQIWKRRGVLDTKIQSTSPINLIRLYSPSRQESANTGTRARLMTQRQCASNFYSRTYPIKSFCSSLYRWRNWGLELREVTQVIQLKKVGSDIGLEKKKKCISCASAMAVWEKAAHILSPQVNKKRNANSLGIQVPLKEIIIYFPLKPLLEIAECCAREFL